MFEFIRNQTANINTSLAILDTIFKENRWGSGWSWNDYQEDYMAERSAFPIYGNAGQYSLVDSNRRVDVERDRGKPILRCLKLKTLFLTNWQIIINPFLPEGVRAGFQTKNCNQPGFAKPMIFSFKESEDCFQFKFSSHLQTHEIQSSQENTEDTLSVKLVTVCPAYRPRVYL